MLYIPSLVRYVHSLNVLEILLQSPGSFQISRASNCFWKLLLEVGVIILKLTSLGRCWALEPASSLRTRIILVLHTLGFLVEHWNPRQASGLSLCLAEGDILHLADLDVEQVGEEDAAAQDAEGAAHGEQGVYPDVHSFPHVDWRQRVIYIKAE